MDISNNFKDSIKSWVQIDNNIISVDDQIEPLKKERNNLLKLKKEKESFILSYMEDNSITNNNIFINDGKIKYYNSKVTEPISKKLVTEKINEFFKNDKMTGDKVLDFILNNREKKIIPTLKRIIDK